MSDTIKKAVKAVAEALRESQYDQLLRDDQNFRTRYRKLVEASLVILEEAASLYKNKRLESLSSVESLRKVWKEENVPESAIEARLLSLHPIPEFADVIPIEEFLETGGVIDSDGTGYYDTEFYESERRIYPSLVRKNPEYLEKGWTHVAWYNK